MHETTVASGPLVGDFRQPAVAARNIMIMAQSSEAEAADSRHRRALVLTYSRSHCDYSRSRPERRRNETFALKLIAELADSEEHDAEHR